jgi:hypothetical protein
MEKMGKPRKKIKTLSPLERSPSGGI